MALFLFYLVQFPYCYNLTVLQLHRQRRRRISSISILRSTARPRTTCFSKSTAGEKSRAQIEAFEDTWHWGDEAELAFDGVISSGNSDAAEILRAMRSFLKENNMMAYLSMMGVRLMELHRVLKSTGSIYLHCNPTASHYLKILIDAVFGRQTSGGTIIWKRTSAHSAADRWGDIHNTITILNRASTPGMNSFCHTRESIRAPVQECR